MPVLHLALRRTDRAAPRTKDEARAPAQRAKSPEPVPASVPVPVPGSGPVPGAGTASGRASAAEPVSLPVDEGVAPHP
ncbi:hypothetical protein GT039_29180 [Streptomyces sp. SID2955]|nr:hypothetical protein [Streptomyces sp. SID2955]